jgi:hypothetical protein
MPKQKNNNNNNNHLSVPNINDNQYHIAKEFARIMGDNIPVYYQKYASELGPGMLIINCDLSNQNPDVSNSDESQVQDKEGLDAIYMTFHQLPDDAKMRILRNYRDGHKNMIYYAISLKNRSFFFEKDLDHSIDTNNT